MRATMNEWKSRAAHTASSARKMKSFVTRHTLMLKASHIAEWALTAADQARFRARAGRVRAKVARGCKVQVMRRWRAQSLFDRNLRCKLLTAQGSKRRKYTMLCWNAWTQRTSTSIRLESKHESLACKSNRERTSTAFNAWFETSKHRAELASKLQSLTHHRVSVMLHSGVRRLAASAVRARERREEISEARMRRFATTMELWKRAAERRQRLRGETREDSIAPCLSSPRAIRCLGLLALCCCHHDGARNRLGLRDTMCVLCNVRGSHRTSRSHGGASYGACRECGVGA